MCECLEITFNQAEVIAVSISRDSEEFLICGVYRPPNRDLPVFLNELHDFLTKYSCNKQVILVGDFNIDTSNSSKLGVTDYLTLSASHGLDHLIQRYTREEILKKRLTRTCLDHINTRIPQKDTLGCVIKEIVADHYILALSVLGYDNAHRSVSGETNVILNSKELDRKIMYFDWDSLLCYDHLQADSLFVQTFKNIYDGSKVKIRITRKKRI